MLKFVAILLSSFLIANALVLSESAFGTTEKSNTKTTPLGTAKVCSALQKKWDIKIEKAKLGIEHAQKVWQDTIAVHGMVGMGSNMEKNLAKAHDQYFITIQQMEKDQISNSCPQTYCGHGEQLSGNVPIDLCLNKNKPIKSNKES
ncbi:MAG: hypothetical protein D4R90_01060 [Nitrosopumilales archaeon]|nr:MAG: hypothetical protein D4R90_01060 [Nitrosopumilales archaeon]